MVIDSPVSYTFEGGQLIGGSDFTLSVLRGNHRWQDVAWTPATTWTPPATREWKPTGSYNFIMDIAAGARFTFAGHIGESQHQRTEYYTLWYNGAGLIKNGDGTAEVTYDHGPRYNQKLEDNRAHRLPTVVNAGVLLVNNTTGSGVSPKSGVMVNPGGTLGGSGAIGNGGTSALVTVHAGGTIAPGSNAGTLTLRDGLTLKDGAKLACELGTAGDLLKVTGGTFTGSGQGGVRVSVADAGGLAVGNTYDLIDWTGAELTGVEVDDFITEPAGQFTGTFQISGSKLQITITSKTPPAAEGSQPVSNEPSPAVATASKPAATFTWMNPNGGSWTDGANWSDGEVPNGPAKEWAQYTFEKPRTLSGVEVYWLDDDDARLVPESWRVLYRQGEEWKPVEAAGAYGVEKDRFNEVKFQPVKTDSLRLEVKVQGSLRADFSAGILEWRVNP
ncbi:MAG: discoidin domain-containing protein [Verrucomicrobiales bacterium]